MIMPSCGHSDPFRVTVRQIPNSGILVQNIMSKQLINTFLEHYGDLCHVENFPSVFRLFFSKAPRSLVFVGIGIACDDLLSERADSY
jgi:hypothetical protein